MKLARKIAFDRFPGGKRGALTLNYDDGTIHDRRMVECMNRHGLRGTFNLNSEFLGHKGYVSREEVASLYSGHEVAVHTLDHPFLTKVGPEQIAMQLLEDRRQLEELTGYPVRGMAYPYGRVNKRVAQAVEALGFAYGRSTRIQENFDAPEEFFELPISCRHQTSLEALEKFHTACARWGLQILHVMGHSFEFDREGNWELLEDLCSRAAANRETWFATTLEIVEYLHALSLVSTTLDQAVVHNRSGLTVFFSDNSATDGWRELGPGQMHAL